MAHKNIFTKSLALLGLVLVWFPILVPLVVGIMRLIQGSKFLFDIFLPLEIFPVPLLGGLLLLIASLLTRMHSKLIGWGLGLSVVLPAIGSILAAVTGLASGETDINTWQGALVIAFFILFWVALLALGIGGVLLTRDVLKENSV